MVEDVNSALGIQAEERMNAGALIPDRTILRLILSELKHKKWVPSQTSVSDAAPTSPSDSPSASFILDGFPRTDLQAQSLSAVIPVNFVVRLITPIDIIIDRIASRWIHPASGRIYNIGFNAPKVAGLDDVTGEKLIQRGDDNPETWRRRLKQFDETSKPLCNFYEKRGLLWTVEGNSSDEISPRLFDEFERRFT